MATEGFKKVKLERHDLIPSDILRELAIHFGKGAEIYSERNWENGYAWSKSYAALQRHANAFWNGQDYDNCNENCVNDCKEHTHSKHMIAVVWHAMVLAKFMNIHTDKDDRVKTSNERFVKKL